MRKEPEIIINGVKCTDAMAMTIRVALSSFLVDLEHEGLGGDAHGMQICSAYQDRIFEIHQLIFKETPATEEMG